jgi:triosephosphate isomerase|tara:strand:+ start:33 stop:776 length:744 start_codon:yes stop_codon:yes gene_type:complete
MGKPLIAGNWKMHGTAESALNLATQLSHQKFQENAVEIIVFPPLVHISAVSDVLTNSNISLGAQNVSQYPNGAYTGEVSAEMLVDQGCKYVLVGHSERRAVLGESDQTVAEKFRAAQNAGLIPILCVGESLRQRQQDATLEVVAKQIKVVIDLVGLDKVCQSVIAYEPVWAIGTGETASPEQAQDVHAAIRTQLGEAGRSTTLLYGGSVNKGNAAELFKQPDINGGLVGGASLEADEFLNIAQLVEA